jgi:hypothetical protein
MRALLMTFSTVLLGVCVGFSWPAADRDQGTYAFVVERDGHAYVEDDGLTLDDCAWLWSRDQGVSWCEAY